MSFKIEIPSDPEINTPHPSSTPVEVTSLLDLFTAPVEKPETPEKSEDDK